MVADQLWLESLYLPIRVRALRKLWLSNWYNGHKILGISAGGLSTYLAKRTSVIELLPRG